MENYEKRFAANLRRLRKAAGLTQVELGRAIGYSEKTVSKWECACGIPDIEGLFSLCRRLCVSIEELFSDEGEVYFLGIDGGGTKTAMILADSTGKHLRSLLTDCCNPVDIGMERAMQVLRKGIYEICEGISLSRVVAFAGIAGGATMKKQLAAFFQNFQFQMFDCDSDNCNIMQAGLGEEDGITLILGTGICAWSRCGRVISRTAGWGYLVDEGGSAYNIGQDALKHYFATVDGAAEGGILAKNIGELYPDGTQALLRQVYEGGKKWIASLAPTVFAAAQAGDKVADAIIRRNMCVAAGIIETAGKHFRNKNVRVVIAGGLTEQPCIIEHLKNALTESGRFRISVLDVEPVTGAVALAQKLWQK
ncbi:MAG: XRE family transcriptional regulator [Ruminococcaceae bacterium]|nr:XRE family transcriptional regulator [Oscillospiraceae bacterium]